MPVPAIIFIAVAIGAVIYFYSSKAQASIDTSGGSSSSSPLPLSSLGGSSWAPPAAAQPYLGAIAEAETRNGLPHNLLARQLDIESFHFRADVIDGTTPGNAGEIGIAQLMPGTAGDLGVDPADPFASINAAALYDRQLFDQFGSWQGALAAYNWGQGNLSNKGIDAAPASTVAYYSKILSAAGLA